MDTYTPNAANDPTSIRYPEDGDAPTEANFFATTQDLADYAAKTREYVNAAGLHVISATPAFRPDKWLLTNVAMVTNTGNAGNTTSEMLIWGLGFIPDGRSITNFAVSLTGQTGHAFLPGQKPRIRLMKFTFSTGSTTQIHEATDGSLSVATYEAQHLLSGSPGSPELVDRTTAAYFVHFIHESGANSIEDGLAVHGVRVNWT